MRLKLKLAIIVAVAGLGVSLLPAKSMAAAGVIYLSPSSVSVRKGYEFTIALRINPGTPVDSVQATVNYSTSHLTFVSLAIGGTFPTCVQESGGGGVVTFACTKLSGSTNSDSLISDITFKALAGSGSSPLSISNANAAKSGSYTYPSSSGANVTFTSPPSSPPKSGSSTSGASGGSTNTSSNSSASSTSSTKSSTPSKSNAITTPALVQATVKASVTKVQITSATVNVSSSTSEQLYVQYGTSKDNLNLTSAPGQPSQSAVIQLDQPGLSPATLYYYQAVAKNTDGKVVGVSPVNSLITKGYMVSVTVLDSHYHPLSDKVVTLHSAIPKQATTNSNGVAIFTDVSPGQHSLSYSINSHTYTQPVYVANNVATSQEGVQTSAPQTAAVILSDYTQPSSNKNDVAVFAVLTVIVVASVLITEREALGKWARSMKKRPGSILPDKPSDNSKSTPVS